MNWHEWQHIEKNKRELARLILEAALDKVEALGFVPLLRERDSRDRRTGRHHIMPSRIDYLYVDDRLREQNGKADGSAVDPQGLVPPNVHFPDHK